jgi:pyruvate, water dikinase
MALFDFFKRKDACPLVTQVDGPMVEKYRQFRDFLSLNRDALNLMAEIEEAFYGGSPFSMSAVKGKVHELLETTCKLAETLNGVSKGKYRELTAVCETIGREIQSTFVVEAPTSSGDFVLPLELVTAEMVSVAGGKATHLATMGNVLGLPFQRRLRLPQPEHREPGTRSSLTT